MAVKPFISVCRASCLSLLVSFALRAEPVRVVSTPHNGAVPDALVGRMAPLFPGSFVTLQDKPLGEVQSKPSRNPHRHAGVLTKDGTFLLID